MSDRVLDMSLIVPRYFYCVTGYVTGFTVKFPSEII